MNESVLACVDTGESNDYRDVRLDESSGALRPENHDTPYQSRGSCWHGECKQIIEMLPAVASSREGTGMISVERTLSRRIEWTQYNAIGREACFLPVLARGAAREV